MKTLRSLLRLIAITVVAAFLTPLILLIGVVGSVLHFVRLVLEPDYVRPGAALVTFDIRGHKVEMFRWLK